MLEHLQGDLHKLLRLLAWCWGLVPARQVNLGYNSSCSWGSYEMRTRTYFYASFIGRKGVSTDVGHFHHVGCHCLCCLKTSQVLHWDLEIRIFFFFFFVFAVNLLAKISKDHRFVSLVVWKVEQWSNKFEGVTVLFVLIRPMMCKMAMVMAYFKNIICWKIKQNVSEKQPKCFKISNNNNQHKMDNIGKPIPHTNLSVFFCWASFACLEAADCPFFFTMVMCFNGAISKLWLPPTLNWCERSDSFLKWHWIVPLLRAHLASSCPCNGPISHQELTNA